MKKNRGWFVLLIIACFLSVGCEGHRGETVSEHISYNGHLYYATYYSGLFGGTQELHLYELTGYKDEDGHIREDWTAVKTSAPNFNDIVDQFNRVRPDPEARIFSFHPAIKKQPRSAQSGPNYFNHMLSPAGGWIRRFSEATQSVDLAKQIACVDQFENAAGFDVSVDNTRAVVVTISKSTGKPCATILDASNYQVLNKVVFPNPQQTLFSGVAISSDNSYAYITTNQRSTLNTTVYAVDLQTGALAKNVTFDGFWDQLYLTPDGTTLFVGHTGDRLLTLTAIDTNTFTATPFNTKVPASPFYFYQNLAMHPDGTRLYAISTQGGPVFTISTADGSILSQTAPIGGDDANYLGAGGKGDPQFSPDGRLLFFLSSSTWISVLDTQTDSLTDQLPLPKNPNTQGDNHTGFFFIPTPPSQ